MTIEERIERVEKQNRRLKWGMTVICVVATGAFVLGQAAPDAVPDVIRAKRFEVVSHEGLAVVTLESWKLGGWIETRNQQGRLLFRVAANDGGGGSLTTFNAKGKEMVNLGATVSGGSLTTFNAKGKEMVSLGSTVSGGGSLTTYNAEGKELVALNSVGSDGVLKGTGMVGVYDPSGRTRRGLLTTRP